MAHVSFPSGRPARGLACSAAPLALGVALASTLAMTHGGAAPLGDTTSRRTQAPTPAAPLSDDAVPQLADPSLVLELVASEPQIQSPVAITFDEHGRLFVVEMIDYPHDRGRHPGRISLLEDADDDGRYERATVFAENLAWPSGAFPYDGGLFVASSPDILYLKDTDGDGRADVRRVVFTGFASTVPEPMPDMVVNGFAWGPDNRIWGATSRNGGIVSAPGMRQQYDLRGRDFSFDPRTRQLRAETGGGQFGVTFDDEGRRFVSSNANHLMQAMYDLRAIARNPYVDPPPAMLDIPADGPAAPVHRLSPDETWRVRRTQWRLSGKVRGLVEYGGKPSGYFTSACSLTIYRGDALPVEYYGSAFVAEPANNLVHRKQLVDDGVHQTGVRPAREADTEFLRSASVWFRPVNFATGPDGALYVVDMHRFVVEDPKTIPAGILDDADVVAGRGQGRIYRIRQRNVPRARPPILASASTAELVAQLAHPNGWVRDTAARLIHTRQDAAAVPALEALASSTQDGAVRRRALAGLHGLGRLTTDHVAAALEAADAGVRVQALALAADVPHTPTLRARVLALVDDPHPRVRYRLAFTLGSLPAGDDLREAMVTLVRRDAHDAWMRTALLSSLTQPIVPIVDALARDAAFRASAGGGLFLEGVLRTIGARGQRPELDAALSLLERTPGGAAMPQGDDDGRRLAWTRALLAGLARGDVPLSRADPADRLAPTMARARQLAASPEAPHALRRQALDLLAQDPRVGAEVFLTVVRVEEPHDLQRAALSALRQRGDAEVALALLERWAALTPRLRHEAAGLLLARPEWTRTLLDAVAAGTVATADLAITHLQALTTHADETIAARAAALLDVPAARTDVVEAHLSALELPADVERGRAVFADVCASCHRLDGVGVDLGPNLRGIRTHGPEGLLVDILDPNRKVDPAFLYHEIFRRDGSSVLGAIVDDQAGSLTIAQAGGARLVVPRADVVRIRAVGRSLMPDGLEATMRPQDLADVIAYLLSR